MKNKPLLLFLIIFLSFIAFIFATYKDYGISWDEISLLYNGKILASNYFDADTLLKLTPPTYLLFHGSPFDALFYLLQKTNTSDLNIDKLHLIKAIFGSLTLLPIFFILRKVSRNIYIPALGTIFLIFYPRWLGDIFDNQEDIIAAVLYAWLIYFGIKILLAKNFNHVFIWLITFILSAALAFSHRVSLIIAPLSLFPLLIFKAINMPQKLKTVFALSLSVFFFILLLFLFSPYIHHYGLAGIYQKLFLAAQTESSSPGQALFDGQTILTTQLPWYYLPKWIMITTPLITLLFFAIGNLAILNFIFRRPDRSRHLIGRAKGSYSSKLGEKDSATPLRFARNDKLIIPYLLLLLSFFLPIFAVIITHITIYDGWRWFLFLSIPLNIIAALGIEYLLNLKFIFPVLAILLFLTNIISTGRQYYLLHPYEYLYFNNLVGGLPGAYQKYETEYWGKSFKEATLWLTDHQITDTNRLYHIYVCDNTDMAFPYFKKNMIATDFINIADYSLCYNREESDAKIMSKGQTIYIVEREGVPLNYVKRLR